MKESTKIIVAVAAAAVYSLVAGSVYGHLRSHCDGGAFDYKVCTDEAVLVSMGWPLGLPAHLGSQHLGRW